MSQLSDFFDRAKERQDRTTLYEGQLASRMQAFQRRLYLTIAELIAGLAVNNSGELLFNVENITKVNRIGVQIQSETRKESKGMLRWILGKIINLLVSNKRYADLFDNSETVDDRIRRKMLLAYGYDIKKKQFITGSYLDAVLNNNALSQNTIQMINRAIAARTPLSDFRNAFRNDFQALTDAQYRRFTSDFFQEFDRAVSLEYAKELGLDHAVFAGTLVEDSREFCIMRVNNIYTDDEIETWNNEQWQGKKQGDVRIVLGGHNCRHILNWVSKEFAELFSEQRGKKINSYNKVRVKATATR